MVNKQDKHHQSWARRPSRGLLTPWRAAATALPQGFAVVCTWIVYLYIPHLVWQVWHKSAQKRVLGEHIYKKAPVQLRVQPWPLHLHPCISSPSRALLCQVALTLPAHPGRGKPSRLADAPVAPHHPLFLQPHAALGPLSFALPQQMFTSNYAQTTNSLRAEPLVYLCVPCFMDLNYPFTPLNSSIW